MGKLSYEFVKELFESIHRPWHIARYGYEDEDEEGFHDFIIHGYLDKDVKSKLKELGLEHIDQQGGGENGSRDCFTIIKYNGEFYKTTYWYASHHGFDGLGEDDFVKVKPKTIEKIVYE